MSKKLSVAIPTYNRLAYLKECINSILNQTLQDFSIFVFDNASQELVAEELKKFNDKRIHFIGSEKNISSAGNINRILNYPFQSEYLIIFHDDDLMHPRMLELETKFLDANKNIGFVVSKFKRVSSQNIGQFRKIEEDKIKYFIYKNSYEFLRAVISWMRFAFDSAMYRREIIGDSRLNFEKFSDKADQVFLLEISKKAPSALIDASLVNYRIHPGQDSKQIKKGYENGIIETLLYIKESLPQLINKEDSNLFSKYVLRILLGSYVDINAGLPDFRRFINKCHQKGVIKYRDFRYFDLYDTIALLSIISKNKTLFIKARSLKDFFERISEKF